MAVRPCFDMATLSVGAYLCTVVQDHRYEHKIVQDHRYDSTVVQDIAINILYSSKGP
jgi:hypothetical protein